MDATLIIHTLDLLLALGLVVLAWSLLASRDLFRAVVQFIVFGLLLALVWGRLNAPDVALTEAAIGAGLTGALLLTALSRLGSDGGDAACRYTLRELASTPQVLAVVLLALAVAGWVAFVALGTSPGAGLYHSVHERLSHSGVSHPVTAVLLNFRAYDTLLEVAVLAAAVIGVWSLGRMPLITPLHPPGEVLRLLITLLIPLAVLVAGYLLWAGGHGPGGAFQGGAVLAAAGVLWVLAGGRRISHRHEWQTRVMLILGPEVFCLVAMGMVAFGRHVLEYGSARAGAWILLIEGAALLSIGAILTSLFSGGGPIIDLPKWRVRGYRQRP